MKQAFKILWANWGDSILAVVFVVLIFTTVVVYIEHGNIWSVQVLSACLGAVITIIATRLLLTKQSDQQQALMKKQEDVDKSIKIHEKKIEVYSEFIKAMWNITEDGTLDNEALITLKNQIFNKLIFYLNDNSLEKLKQFLLKQTESNKPKVIDFYAQVTNLLREELNEEDDNTIDNTEQIRDLWNIINNKIGAGNLDKEENNDETDNKFESTILDTSNITTAEKKLDCQSWHFIMLDPELQLEKLPETKELSLIEYNGEKWRTNLVRQVKDGDLVFLFRKGGYGYIGAFRAKGWRIFDIKAKKEEIMEGVNYNEITDEKYNTDISKYDIYESDADGADWCANIIVEPIAFKYDGVGNPGGVYRRTISRYYDQYASQLLKMFREAKKESTYGMINENTKIELVKDELI